MKILNNKKSTQKILVAILIVLSFNFIAPTFSRADFGGVLFGPIIDLLAGIFDAIGAGLQYYMYDGGASLVGTAVGSAASLINPFDLFMPSKDDYIAKYGSSVTTRSDDVVEIIKEDDLDQGWFGWRNI